jgi:hypothetical protein
MMALWTATLIQINSAGEFDLLGPGFLSGDDPC